MTLMDAGGQISKRELLALIGHTAGLPTMYMAMSSLGYAPASAFTGAPKLSAAPKGATVLILGAGLAGLVAALELSRAGYTVQLLEYNERVGGRCWTIRGGDRFTEMGGAVQDCTFAPGTYFNPGPWRIPYNHEAVLHYCTQLGVRLEPFVQLNYNAFVHSTAAFGGKPQRYRHVQADFYGGVSELLAKAVRGGELADTVTTEEAAVLLEALRAWGALDREFKYVKGAASSNRRGWDKPAGGGLSAEAIASDPVALSEVLSSGLWKSIGASLSIDHQSTIFQPVGGMDMIAKAFEKEVGQFVRRNSKVTAIRQTDRRVTVEYLDTKTEDKLTASADWCLCTIPLSILSQIEMDVGGEMAGAIRAVPYEASHKIGLEFRRRFWEQDDKIFGGITSTDLPISQISYPSTDYGAKGPAVLLGAYGMGAFAYEFTSLDPQERIRRAVEWGAQIHPQYPGEFVSGMSVAWHRVPWTLGCFGGWSAEARTEHYKNLCQIDGRIMLAGEHASFLPAWQEGAITSSLDAIKRLHQAAVARKK